LTPQRWRRINEIFHLAREKAAGDVESYVREVCAGDDEMRSEVEDMLREHSRTGFMDESPWSPARADGRTFVFSPGELIAGRYRILRFVSRGGMGEVYEAEDLELHERDALKTLLPAIADDQRMIGRFKQEIQLSRKIGHPNVCRVFDLGMHAGTYFLTMEFLDGETLAARLERDGPLDPQAALVVLEHIAGALDAAHAAGIIHRDLKPSNVMLVPGTATGAPRAVVTDFGLARTSTSGDATQTFSSRLIGTFDYMAPELFTGQPASMASDIYAFGMVAQRITAAQTLDAVWKRAIATATDSDPARRFRSARDFTRALRDETVVLPLTISRRKAGVAVAAAFVSLCGVLAWRAWRPSRIAPSAEALELYRRATDYIQAGAYFAASRLLDHCISLAPHFPLAHARLAEAWVELRAPERAKDAMLRLVPDDVAELSEINRLEVEAIRATVLREYDSAVTRYEDLNRRAPRRFDMDLGRAYEKVRNSNAALACYRRAAEGGIFAAWLRIAVILSRRTKEDAPAAEEAFAKAQERYRADNNNEGLTELAMQRGIWANRRNRFPEGADQLRSAIASARMAGNVYQEIAASLQLATNAFLSGDSNTAVNLTKEGLALAQTNQLEALAVTSFINLGQAYRGKSDLAGAEQAYRDALNLALRGNAHFAAAGALHSLALLHDQQHRYEESAAEAREALESFRTNRMDSEAASCLTILARSYSNRGQIGPALVNYRAARDLAEKSGDRNLIYLSHSSVGNLLMQQDQLTEALDEFQLGLPYGDNQYAGYAALHIGEVLWKLGRFDEASKQFAAADAQGRRFPALQTQLEMQKAEMAVSETHRVEAVNALRRLQGSLSASDLSTASEYNRILGIALLAAGRANEGLRACEEALALASKLERTDMVPVRLALIEARVKAYQAEKALQLFRENSAGFDARPEARWRALALLSAAGHSLPEDPSVPLKQLLTLWGEGAYQGYLNRPDIRTLSWPVLHPKTAR
jgi:Tfp pilus assembly protein PilF